VVPLTAPAVHSDPLGKGARRGSFRSKGNHAARSVPIERGASAPEHLGSLDVGKVDVGKLTLSVREGLGHSVEQDLEAAHPEVRAAAEPPDGDALIQGEVVPVGHHDTREVVQRLVQAHRQLTPLNILAVEDADRVGDLLERLFRPGHGHLDLG
jgi:hypothetical protein